MTKKGRIWATFLAVCMLWQPGAAESLAAGREPYTYTVTFHAGNQGTFPAEGSYNGCLKVVGSPGWHSERAADGSSVTVSGIQEGAQVSYDAALSGAVVLPEGSRYYVRGVRRSGYDNTEAEYTVFAVNKDLDYVIAYGIQGDMTTYRVNYVDAAGNELADHRIYTGKVGDRPVAAYQYIEGWQPQAYNLTKVLVKDESENVFNFIYTRVRTGGGGGGGGTAAGAADGGAAAVTPDAGAGTGADAPPAQAGAGGAAGGAAAGAPGGAAGAEAGEISAAVPDEEVPADEGPRDLIDLDDEEVPLAEAEPAGSERLPGNMLMSVTIGLTAALALALLLIFWIRSRRREDSGEEE